ncbi:uncharacterized protein EDB91DRAFT_1254668 [Suillus paluster]|uniref:uncharacterized protein n=1 Tax=Suillus paluster TaxID=48578 RepID=UPI001B86E456|nr:uncharacterized protein EDB91DRAFT_1254668 [Suillus paluster]KAG1725618.1 hypothetical protein EDB91DRAFT_1254668 [Suillus paluster]
MSSLSISEVADLQISKYANREVLVDLGGLAILIYDYCITFQDEVQWTWSRPWGFTRVIFTISRYLPFVGAGMTAYAALRVSGPCDPSVEENIIHILTIVAAEGLLVIRTWAFWQNSRRVLIGLLTYSVVTIIAAIAVNVVPNHQLIPGGNSSPGCNFESSRNAAVVYSILAMFEIVILILNAYKRFHDYRDEQSSIVTTLYGDGMLYISCIIAITVTNVIVDAAFPIGYSNMFDTLQLVLHSVLASRILFRLQSSNNRAYEPSMSLSVLEGINYAQPSQMQTSGTQSETSEV